MDNYATVNPLFNIPPFVKTKILRNEYGKIIRYDKGGPKAMFTDDILAEDYGCFCIFILPFMLLDRIISYTLYLLWVIIFYPLLIYLCVRPGIWCVDCVSNRFQEDHTEEETMPMMGFNPQNTSSNPTTMKQYVSPA